MIGLLFAAVGLGLFGYGLVQLRPAYHVYKGETQDIIEVERKDGPVEVDGTATSAGKLVQAPISGQECLAYEYSVEEYKNSGNNSSWKTVDKGQAAAPFRLEDRTASVLVDATTADISLETNDSLRVDGGEEAPPAVQEFLDRNADLTPQNDSIDLAGFSIGTGNDRRYHESRLHVDDPAYVLGQTDYDIDARESMRDISAVVRDGEEAPAFVVAQGDRERTAKRLFFEHGGLVGVGLLMTAIGLAVSAPQLLRAVGV